MPRRSHPGSENIGFASNPLGDDRPTPPCTAGCGNDCDTDRADGLCADCSGGTCDECQGVCPVDVTRCPNCVAHAMARVEGEANVPQLRPDWWRAGDWCWLGILREASGSTRGLGASGPGDGVVQIADRLEKLWGHCCLYPACSGATGYTAASP